MDKRRLFHIAGGIAGGVLAALALSSIAANGVSTSTGLMAIGGGGMLLGAGYELLSSKESQFEPDAVSLTALVLCTGVALVGAVLLIVG